MKKALTVGLLILGGIIWSCGLSFVNIIWFVKFYVLKNLLVALLGVIVMTMFSAFILHKLYALFKMKFGLSAPRFLLISCAPSVILSLIYVAVTLIIADLGYYNGKFLGASTAGLFSMGWLVSAASTFAFTALIFLTMRFAESSLGVRRHNGQKGE